MKKGINYITDLLFMDTKLLFVCEVTFSLKYENPVREIKLDSNFTTESA
jgi:hypothetical protein